MTLTAEQTADVRLLLVQAIGLIDQQSPDSETEVLTSKELARVEKLGPILHEHYLAMGNDAHGSTTRGESLKIRRSFFGAKVQGSAALFGLKDSGALLYRDRLYGSPVKDDDPIRFTDEGRRILALYRERHDL